MSYADFQVKSAPAWLQRSYGSALLSSLGSVKDTFVDELRQAVKAKMPTLAPVDALPHIANERGLPQGAGESNSAWAVRLEAAWAAWSFAGSGYSILTALTIAGYPNAVIVQQNGTYLSLTSGVLNIGTLSGTPPAWTFNITNNIWSRFAVILPGPTPTSWINSAAAVFTGVETYIDITWPTPMDTLPVVVTSLVVTDTDSFPVINLINKTTTGIRVATSDFFSGRVELLAFNPGADPFCNPQSAITVPLRTAVSRWQWGNANCAGIYAIRSGSLWGWPVQTWGAVGLNWGGNVFYIAP